ncbi:hypothetical protein FB192DRAFT_1307966 [Mucor lusitanicus]|nr:hypothetical protein FB192DRAFT_1407311 [Mucor lusitanicus]KAF1799542.1 hypothetical protein FB192DRAFT_1307966 [Mucor lusitanicus]
MYARNDTHLLSTKSNFDCLSCDSPPVATNQKQHSTYHYTSKQLFEACLDRGKLAEYYMSIVLVTRNDNYGDDQLDRLQNMLDSTFMMAQDTKTRMEVLIIEWNPIQGKRSIADTYRFRRSDYLTWRIITVPPQIHDAFGYPQPKALYEFEGKNLGIRYARGEFVVCVNQDDIWSQNMYNAIKARTWRKKMLYTQRQGIHHASSQDSNLNDSTLVQLSPFATDQEIQSSCNFTTDTHEPHPMQMVSLSAQNYLRIGHEASDFTLAHRDVWTAVGGYREAGATIWMDVEFLVTAHVMGYPIVYSETPFNCHQTHARVEHEGASNDNRHVQVDHIFENKVSYSNARLGKHWGLSHIQDLYEQGLQCQVFRGGLGV